MAKWNYYHGGPAYDPALTFSAALFGAPGGSPGHAYIGGIGAVADFVLDGTGTFVTGFRIYDDTSGGLPPITPPLLTGSGYHFLLTDLSAAIAAWVALNPAPLFALLDVTTTYNGSHDKDKLVDITTHNAHLNGFAGNDSLTGGSAKDFLDGGLGADRFIFNSVSDSLPGNRDVLTGFSHAQHDRINLAAIDADQRPGHPGNQAFTFIGSQTFALYALTHGFSAAHTVRVAGGHLEANVNANLAADFVINLIGASAIGAGDLIL